uniref:Ionotropic glutamate receptor C-terminal domain-containing protein n=1 Tax=Hemiselmis tepida TaxID=464990 RepID=A0A7S0YRR6_9CRYP|mmetsp:Transcript_19357/g.49016  ORF Transcript_19357/g.49016 Transcript_19357/m.49016 type:complete len:934 (+) Transcript_19357:71-2872(+)
MPTCPWKALIPVILGSVLLAATCTAAAEKDNGKFECPCITGDAELRAKVRPVLEKQGQPLNYGMDGCSAYDLESTSCEGLDPPAWCTQRWCYVDQDLCPVHKAKCAEAGGTVGSSVSPYCETRQHHASQVIPNSTAPLYYSYSTCDSLNLYDSVTYGSSVAGSTIKACAVEGNAPFSVPGPVDERKPEWKGLIGLLVDITDYTRKGTEPNMGLEYIEGWATAAARKLHSSSYTACVYDVIVGNFDVCLGDFWITPARLDMMSQQPGQPAQFVIPYREDKIYLVAPSIENVESFADLLEKPFLPFKPDLWGLVIGFTIFSSLVSAFIDRHNDTDYHNKSIGSRIFKSLYLHSFWYVSGGPLGYPVSVPSRLASLGFGLFTLITLATFTANLASLLVTKNLASGVQSIEQAIDLGLTICIPAAMAGQVKAEYPLGRYLEVAETQDVYGYMYTGKCGVGVSAEIQVTLCHGGQCVERDCKLEDSGEAEKGSTGCIRLPDGSPDLTRDCMFQQVGPTIISIPISIPINKEYAPTFNLNMREFTAKGLYDQSWKDHTPTIPLTQCLPGTMKGSRRRSQPQSPVPSLDSFYSTPGGIWSRSVHEYAHGRRAGGAAASKSKGGATGGGAAESAAAGATAADIGGGSDIEDMRLDYTALLGTVIVGSVVYAVAAIIAFFEHWFDRPIQSIFGFSYHKDSDDDCREHGTISIAQACFPGNPAQTGAISGELEAPPPPPERSCELVSTNGEALLEGKECAREDKLMEKLLQVEEMLQAKLDKALTQQASWQYQNPAPNPPPSSDAACAVGNGLPTLSARVVPLPPAKEPTPRAAIPMAEEAPPSLPALTEADSVPPHHEVSVLPLQTQGLTPNQPLANIPNLQAENTIAYVGGNIAFRGPPSRPPRTGSHLAEEHPNANPQNWQQPQHYYTGDVLGRTSPMLG